MPTYGPLGAHGFAWILHFSPRTPSDYFHGDGIKHRCANNALLVRLIQFVSVHISLNWYWITDWFFRWGVLGPCRLTSAVSLSCRKRHSRSSFSPGIADAPSLTALHWVTDRPAHGPKKKPLSSYIVESFDFLLHKLCFFRAHGANPTVFSFKEH